MNNAIYQCISGVQEICVSVYVNLSSFNRLFKIFSNSVMIRISVFTYML